VTQAFSRRHTSNISTDAYGNDLAVTDAEGHVTSSAYNSYNEPCWTAPIATTSTSCNNPPPDATVNTYDSYGNLIATVDPLGNHTTHSYDAYGDVLSTTDPNGNTTTYTYNSNTGEVASEVDALGNKTTNTYYPDGQVETSVSPLGNVSGGTPANYTTSYSYNQSAWLTSETTPGSRTTTTTYDPDGNVLTTTDPQGYITNYGYDLEDRQCWSVKGTVTGTPSCTSPPADVNHLSGRHHEPGDGHRPERQFRLLHLPGHLYDVQLRGPRLPRPADRSTQQHL
jgi:YD repeat-containing protein